MPISTCAVTGNVKNLLNSNVQNCTVKASILTPFFHGPTWISGELASTTTDSSGNFSLSTIETETVGKKVTFSFEYNDGTGTIRKRSYTVIVPDTATVALSDLVTADESPITANTFPASSVTVIPTGNLTSDDAQDALTELQTDIDALNTLSDGKIYVGNASNVAAEVTPSGDVTINNAGVTAISSGAIVNADINAAAAISHTKLADITAASVLLGNASNVPTATALTGDVTVSSSGVTAIASGVIVNADVNASAAIAYSKLNLATSIVNADVSASADIARTKLASGNNYRILANNSSGVMSENAALTAKHVVIADANGQLSGVAPGSANNVLKSDGTDWTSGSVPQANLSVTTKTGNYTLTNSDDVVLVDATGGDVTITTHASASAAIKPYVIKKIDSSTNKVTVDGNSSETIDGAANAKLVTQNEALTIIPDATNWQIRERRVPEVWTDYTPTYDNMGSVSTDSAQWMRVGPVLKLRGRFTAGTGSAAAASISIPNTSVWTWSNPTSNGLLVGAAASNAASNYDQWLIAGGATTGTVLQMFNAEAVLGTPTLGNVFNSQVVLWHAELKMTDWEG